MIYLDNNATTRPGASVVEAVKGALTEWWQNPSSVHRPGQAARQQVELARRDVAELIGARPREIVFTSSGTEAIDMAIRGVLLSGRRRAGGAAEASAPKPPPPPPPPLSPPPPTAPPAAARPLPVVVTTRVEHAAVRDLVEDLERTGAAEVRWAPVMREGIVDVSALVEVLEGAMLASIQWANNETGAIQPVEEIGRLCRDRRVLFHCDATQWVGKEPTDAPSLPVDVLTFSAHKFHGPKGVGMLWSQRGVRLRPTMHGAQELGRRGGTENVPGICGAGAAAREALAWLSDGGARERLRAMRDQFEGAVLAGVPDAVVNGPRGAGDRIWNTTNIGFPRVEAEALLLMLSERGICASAGAACSSGSLDPSPVLLAMGVVPEVAHGSLRFSLSRETTEQEIVEAARVVVESVRDLRQSLGVTG